MEFDEATREFVILEEDKQALELWPLPRLPDRLPEFYGSYLLERVEVRLNAIRPRNHGADVQDMTEERQRIVALLENNQTVLLGQIPVTLDTKLKEYLHDKHT